MIGLYDLISGWNYFFFHPEPASTIGLARILIGICSFLNALWLLPNCDRYFGPEGFFKTKYFTNSTYDNSRLNVFRYLPSSIIYTYLVMVLLIIFSVCLLKVSLNNTDASLYWSSSLSSARLGLI